MKILINTPSLKFIGGVTNHYIGLKPYWNQTVKYNTVGTRNKKGGGVYWLPWDIMFFILRLILFKPDVVILNPSLDKNAINRDKIFMKIALLFHIKTFVFIHGWNNAYSETLNKKKFVKNINKTNGIFVLAKEFKDELIKWGVSTPIYMTTTKVNNNLINNFNINSRNGKIETILFLSRIEKEKGIFIAIDTFSILKEKYPELKMRIVGNGRSFESSKQYVIENRIKDIYFTGSLSGQSLIDEFKKGDVYIFPSYSEGMPTSVLEAMAFGLPIIARPVGGLVDFFKQKENGFLIESFKPEEFATKIEYLINFTDECRKISKNNHLYAVQHFMASNVAKHIENTIKEYGIDCLR